MHIALENTTEAEVHLSKVQQKINSTTPIRTKVIAKEVEADLHALKSDWHSALIALNQGLDLAYGISEQNDLVGELLRRKARVFYELEHDEEAFATAKQALEICELVGEIYEIGAIFRTLGLLAERRQEYSEAENLILKAIEFYSDKDEKFERAHSHREIASFYLRVFRYRDGDQDLREAFRHCATALSLFDEMGIVSRQEEMQEMLDDLTKRLPSRPFVPPAGSELLAIGKAHGIVTGDPAMAELLEIVTTVAPSSSAVLITGETGTGKELFASAIHDLSKRRSEKMVVVNCAAIPDELMESELFGHLRGSFTGAYRDRKGKFALAHLGTLFLDEIGDLSPRLQAKLLRVLQDGIYSQVGSDEMIHADVRLISATNRDLEARVEKELFRKDLLYRLNHVTLNLPPLHKRGGDATLLALFFLHEESERLGRKIEMDSHAMDKIRAYPWPGNVRELLNFIRRAALFARETGRITTKLFPESYLTPMVGYEQDLATIVLAAEKRAIMSALAGTNGNRAAAARLLGISRSTINDKIRRYGLTPRRQTAS